MSLAARIAIACSGLGHVQRGVESWAADTARALQRAGIDATLFGTGPRSGLQFVALPTIRRTDPIARRLADGLRHLGGWRYGMGSTYDVEQTSFAAALLRHIRSGFDIIHVQDPMIATWLERANRAGISRAKVIYANGTGEDARVMRRFSHLQLLTQSGFDDWMPLRPPGQAVYMIPNFVDTARFCPGNQAEARIQFGLPPERTIILCCAAIRRFHKRIDVLLEAFAQVSGDAMLVIAGGREAETDALIASGERLMGQRVRFLPDLPRDSMPALYRAANAFVLPSLHEMFGIVLLEALASGLPVLCHDTSDFRAIVGPGGLYRDLATPDGLAQGLQDLSQGFSVGLSGRSHAEALFSERAVTGLVLEMYRSIQAEATRARQ